MTNQLTTRERILQAVQECGHAGKAFSRQRIEAMTGLRMSQVDDHLDRLRDDGKIVKILAGVYELVREYPEFEPISYTPMLDQGILILEQGDVVIKMGFPAARLHAMMLAGFLQQAQHSESEAELRQSVSRLEADGRASRRAQAGIVRTVARLQRKAAPAQIDMWPDPSGPGRPKEGGEAPRAKLASSDT